MKISIHSVTAEDVSQAYLKLKSHVYYDSTDLLLRKQLAIFETGLDKGIMSFPPPYGAQGMKNLEDLLTGKFAIIADAINKYNKDNAFFDYFLDQIRIIPLPKKLYSLKKKRGEPDNFLTNRRIDENYDIDNITLFIDLPIELHIVSIIWLMRHGYKLDRKLDKTCLGNRLVLTKDKDKIPKGSGLFKPYFNQYLKWRDDAINEAKSRLANKENIAFLNLDLREYFYSVRIDFSKIEKEIEIKSNDAIHNIFKGIHAKFTQMLQRRNLPNSDLKSQIGKNVVLPIGMPWDPLESTCRHASLSIL